MLINNNKLTKRIKKYKSLRKSIKVNNEGLLVLSPYQGDATAVSGALIYSASSLFVGG